MSFSIFNNPFTTFSSGYSSSYSSVDSTYSTSSTGSSLPHSPSQRHGEADAAMYPLLKPVTASRPVTGTVSTLLDTQPRPTIISHRHTSPQETTTTNNSYTTASLSLTRFLFGKKGRTGTAPSVTSSGASTPRHSRSRSAGDVLDADSRSVARSRESSVTRLHREQQRLQRIRDTARILKEELEREGFYVPEEGFNEVNLAAGDTPYKHPRDTPRTTSEIVLDDENGPYAADRAAGRRSSVMVPNEMNSIGARALSRAIGGWLAFIPTRVYSTIRDSAPCARCVIKGSDINTHDSAEYFHVNLEEDEDEMDDTLATVYDSADASDLAAEEAMWCGDDDGEAGLNGDGIESRTLTQRPPTTHEQPEEPQPQPTLPAEPAQPKHLPVPVPGPVPSAPVSHPPTPPLSGDEAEPTKPAPKADDGTVSILPYLPTPPPNTSVDLANIIAAPFPPIEVFRGLGPVIPVELPAEAFKGVEISPPVLSDGASDKGKQKEIEPESVEVQIIEAIPDEKEIDALVGKVPVTHPVEKLEEWETVDKDAGAEALAAATAAAEASKGKEVAIPDEKEVHILPVDVPAVEETPAPAVDLPKEDNKPPVTSIEPVVAPVPDVVKAPLEPRRLEDEMAPTPAVTTVPKESEAAIVDEIAKAVDTPVSPVSPAPEPVVDEIAKVVDAPVSPVSPAPENEIAKVVDAPVSPGPEPVVDEIAEVVDAPVAPAPEPVVEEIAKVVDAPVSAVSPVPEQKTEEVAAEPVEVQPKTEVIAPEPEEEKEIENDVLTEDETQTPSSAQVPVEQPKTAVVEEDKKTEEEEEPAPVPQIVPTTPTEEIAPIVPAQENSPEPEPSSVEQIVPVAEESDEKPHEKPDVLPINDESAAIEPESQPPMTPPIEKDIQDDFKPIVGDVSPRIPTPPMPEKSLDWDKLVNEICMDRDDETGFAKGEEIVTERPIAEDVVQIPGPSVEPTVTIQPVPEVHEVVPPIPTLPQDVIDDLTPTRHSETKHTVPPAPLPPRRIEDEEKPHVPELLVNPPTTTNKAPTKPDLPEFGSQQPAEEHLQVEPEEDAVVTSPAREEPVSAPVAVLPIDTVKPEVIPPPPPVRNLDDERADDVKEKGKGVAADTDSDDGQWVPKFKETTPGTTAPVEPETPTKVTPTEPETPATPSHPELERTETHVSTKEKSGLRRLGRTLSFGSKKQPHMGDLRPGTSHSAAISVGSVDDDRKSMAESTRRPNFLSRTSTKRILTMGLAGKDKEKKDNASVVNSEGVISPAGKAASVRSVSGAISPASESAPATPVKRTTRDIMKLAIGKKKKPEAGADSTPSSPIDGPATSPAATPSTNPLASPGPNKRINLSNAVNLMMKKKKVQDEKVKSLEAAAAAAAGAVSPPATPSGTAASPPATPSGAESAPSTPAAATETPDEATPPPPTPRRRNTITMNNAVNLMMLRKKVKEDKAEGEKSAPSAPGTPGGDDSAVAVDDDKPPATPATEPAEAAPAATPRRRNTLTLKEATNLMSFRKKVKDEKEEHDKTNGSSDAAVDDSAVDATSATEVSPPPTPMKRRNTMSMNNAVNLMMLRKGKDKKEKGKESDESSPDADSSAAPKKDKRMSMFGRKKSSHDSPTIGASASRPITSGTLSGEGMKSNASFAPPPLESEHPGVGLAIDAESSKQPSKAPSVYSVDQRPGTSASTRNFGGFFKKRTPSVYSKDTPDSPNPFNSPSSPFPGVNGAERHTEGGISPSEGEDNGKPKFSRRWSSALGSRGKTNRLSSFEAPGSASGNPPGTAATSNERPGTSASVSKAPATPSSPSKIPVPVATGGTVPLTSSNPPSVAGSVSESSRPKLANRARTFMAFGSKKK